MARQWIVPENRIKDVPAGAEVREEPTSWAGVDAGGIGDLIKHLTLYYRRIGVPKKPDVYGILRRSGPRLRRRIEFTEFELPLGMRDIFDG